MRVCVGNRPGMEDFHTVHTALFLCSFFALPPPLFAPSCIRSRSSGGAGHGHVGLEVSPKSYHLRSSISVSRPSWSGSSAFPIVVPFPPAPAISFVGGAEHEHCGFVFATGQGWKTSTPRTGSYRCAASSPFLPRRRPSSPPSPPPRCASRATVPGA